MTPIEDLIRTYVSLGRRTAKGFEPCICAACNDYKPRGAFKFSHDTIGYNCFNCSLAFTVSNGNTSSDGFKCLLAFGIPADELSERLKKERFEHTKLGSPTHITSETKSSELSAAPTIELPPGAKRLALTDNESPWAEVALEYLKSRKLLPYVNRFFITDEPSLEGRLLIPSYSRHRLVYWQGRALDTRMEPRFKNPLISKDSVIFNDQALYNDSSILYVTEGAFDALSIGEGSACALLGSKLTAWKLNELRRAAKFKKIVFVIDKNLPGYKLGQQALAEGWSVVTMPDGIDDANHCLTELGDLYLLTWLSKEQRSGFEGEVILKLSCDLERD